MTDLPALPRYIQRVMRRFELNETSKGVDRRFQFDYMGAAEFEYGALPKALKQMREAVTRKSFVCEIGTHLGSPPEAFTAYLVGAPATQELARRLFIDQLKPRAEREGQTKERSEIFETYFPNADPVYWKHRKSIDGWWVVEIAEPFILFKEKAHAQEWLELL